MPVLKLAELRAAGRQGCGRGFRDHCGGHFTQNGIDGDFAARPEYSKLDFGACAHQADALTEIAGARNRFTVQFRNHVTRRKTGFIPPQFLSRPAG